MSDQVKSEAAAAAQPVQAEPELTVPELLELLADTSDQKEARNIRAKLRKAGHVGGLPEDLKAKRKAARDALKAEAKANGSGETPVAAAPKAAPAPKPVPAAKPVAKAAAPVAGKPVAKPAAPAAPAK